MSFIVTHRLGEMDRDVPVDELRGLLDEPADDADDHEHADVAVSDESGWILTIAHADGGYHLIWEDVEGPAAEPVHLSAISRGETLRI